MATLEERVKQAADIASAFVPASTPAPMRIDLHLTEQTEELFAILDMAQERAHPPPPAVPVLHDSSLIHSFSFFIYAGSQVGA